MFIRLPISLALILLCFIGASSQTTKRLKVYIKIEARSARNQHKIASTLRRHLRPHRKLFLFIFIENSLENYLENNPDIMFTVKEGSNGTMELLLNNAKSGIHYVRFESMTAEIVMFSALEARIREVGRDQALEEFRESWKKKKRK
jgi:hypothetical protein